MHQKCKVHNIRSQQTNIAPKTSAIWLQLYSDKNNCSLDNKCLTLQILYQADVTNDTDDTYKYYLGLAEASFKGRYKDHILFFNNEQNKQTNKQKTEWSKYVWYLKNE